MILKLWIFRLLEHWVWLIYSPNWWAKSWGFPLIRCRPSCSFTNSNSCTNSSYICGCNSLLSYSCFGCKSWRYSMTTKSVKILCKIPWRVLWSVLRNLWSQPRAKVADFAPRAKLKRQLPYHYVLILDGAIPSGHAHWQALFISLRRSSHV